MTPEPSAVPRLITSHRWLASPEEAGFERHLRWALRWRRSTIRRAKQPEDAQVCIDQLEFPNIPCAYPGGVGACPRGRRDLCQAAGKRLCDAHEWEGRLRRAASAAPDYRFDLADGVDGQGRPCRTHAQDRTTQARASPRKTLELRARTTSPGVCAAASQQERRLRWWRLGSDAAPTPTRPAPLPTVAARSACTGSQRQRRRAHEPAAGYARQRWRARGSEKLGCDTEMKGSWFIFDSYRAHADWCRWRAPFWHGSRVRDPKSHANYHLGFRCCKTLVD